MTKQQTTVAISLWCVLIAFVLAIPYIPYNSERQVNATFLDDAHSDQAYVFFGFSACADVCPTSLALLRNIMQEAKQSNKLPQVAFIDIDLNSNSLLASRYARQFHPDFIGFFPSAEQRQQLIADFGLNLKQRDNDIQHSGRTFLLRREGSQWWLVKTFNPQAVSSSSLLNSLI